MNKGFTLIELLVVVLIIGILASIALPQYTKAVERSRMAEAVQILGDLATAQSIFYMQHNAFASDLDDLNDRGDVTIPGPSGDNWELEVADGVQTITRQGGMYDDAALRLTVSSDGSILKECLPNGHDAFCSMAETAGYSAAAAAPNLGSQLNTMECKPGKCGWKIGDVKLNTTAEIERAAEEVEYVRAEDVAKWLKYVEEK